LEVTAAAEARLTIALFWTLQGSVAGIYQSTTVNVTESQKP
jgi:hypothetical protein